MVRYLYILMYAEPYQPQKSWPGLQKAFQVYKLYKILQRRRLQPLGLGTTYITSNLCAWTMFYQCQWFYEPIRVLDMCKGAHILGVVYCVRAVDFTSGPIDCCTACHHDAMHCIKCGNLASRIGNNMHLINYFPFHRKVLYTVLYLSKL